MSRCSCIVLAVAALACGPRRAPGTDRTGDRDAALAPSSVTDAAVDAPVDSPGAAEQDAGAVALADPPESYGSVSGTAFWLGPPPKLREDRRIQLMDGRARDWEGDEDAEYYCLEDVVVSAIPVRATAASKRTSRNWPAEDSLSCSSLRCPPYVTLSTTDQLELRNHTRTPVSWELRRDGRLSRAIDIPAARIEPPELLDVSGLEAGVYEIVDASGARVGWLYRAAPDELVVGATRGNCRYSISLAPGTYRVLAWHPDLAMVEKPVEIRTGVIRRVNPVFSAKDLRP